ncbi:MFS transporter [Brachybacterium paraconglomeratum]|uniref:MFS transporter n=1 Tax=Brachybacterium paraconglomeratum TaxID=173362 RepID=UPI00223AD0C1|nr:MFS transporter [Brachybacterium paraconglomeratum]MCT1436672.1 MHS family MFS transporter [Brachybacterium paraconglomeratum]
MTDLSSTPTTETSRPPRERRRAMVSSWLGTTVEYYDFLLYGTAASLVFPELFFPGAAPLLGVLASFASLAVGYFARPLGAVVFGHFGDRLGRRKMLVVTLVMMGAASFLMGLLPTYHQIGMAAPVLLVTLRILQGFAVGGEWAGAALMSMEHARPKGRGFAASVVASGGPSGAVLATLVLTPFSMLPSEQFLSWGWRVPFILSALLVVIGLVLRLVVTESPEFRAAAQRRATSSAPASNAPAPIVAVLRHNPRGLVAGALGTVAPLFMQSILATFVLTYAVTVGGHERSDALWLITIANAVHIVTIPAFAALSDKVGRRPVMIAGAAAGIVLIWPMFALVANGSWGALLLAFLIGNPLVQAIMYGPLGAWIGEKFAADVRYTGVAVTYQLGSTLGAGLAPLAATGLLALGGGTNPIFVIALFAGLCVISGAAYLLSRESHDDELALVTGPEGRSDGEAAPAAAAAAQRAEVSIGRS